MHHNLKQISAVLLSVLLCGLTAMPASAAGTIGDIHSDTTGRELFSVGERYSFLITPNRSNAKVSYTVGNGKVLQTFVSKKPVKNKNGTTTYTFGFRCTEKGETGIYVTEDGKTTCIFSVYVGDTVQHIIDKIKASNYTASLNSEEMMILLDKGGEKGHQAFEELIRHAKPVPLRSYPMIKFS